MAQGFTNALQPIQDRAGSEHMRGIRSLTPARLDQVVVAEEVEEGVKEQAFSLTIEQARAEFTEDGSIKARIIEGQGQGELPDNAASDTIGGLAIGEAFGKGHDEHEGEAGRIFGGLTIVGEEAGKERI